MGQKFGMSFTFRFGWGTYTKDNERMVRDFMREIIIEENMQLGYIGCLATIPNMHGHFAVTASKENQEKFLQIDKRKWRKRWAEKSGQSMNALFIDDIYDSKGWENYLDKNIKEDVDSTMTWYGKKLLNRRENDEE